MTTNQPSRALLNVAQVAELYGLDPETVRRMTRTGEIPGFKVGKGRNSPYRYRLASLEADMTRREKAMKDGRQA